MMRDREPKQSWIEVDFEKRTKTLYHDFRGIEMPPSNPVKLECDYCCQTFDRLWFYRTRPFGTAVLCANGKTGYYVYEGGRWSACVYCRPMVEDRDDRLLFARIASLHPEQLVAEPYIRHVWSVVWQCRDGEVQYWESGQKW